MATVVVCFALLLACLSLVYREMANNNYNQCISMMCVQPL